MSLHHKIIIVGKNGPVSLRLQKQLNRANQPYRVIASKEACEGYDWAKANPDLVVICTIQQFSKSIVEQIPANIRVLDVSPQFRGATGWVYGLPELPGKSNEISAAHRVANPGCFASAAILGLAPLVRAGLVNQAFPLYIDGVGGYSTGGANLIAQAASNDLPVESVRALTKLHPHIAEIKQHAEFNGKVFFKPKVAATALGIRVMIPLAGISADAATKVLKAAYSDAGKIEFPDACSSLSVDALAGQSGAAIRVVADEEDSIVIVNIDNLDKGAAGTAFDNIQLMLDGRIPKETKPHQLQIKSEYRTTPMNVGHQRTSMHLPTQHGVHRQAA